MTTEPLMSIWEAVGSGHWHIVKERLRHDPSLINVTGNVKIRGKGYKKATLLHLASALTPDVEVLKHLVAQGANINAVARKMPVNFLVHHFDPTAATKFDADAFDERRLQNMISRGANINEMASRGWEAPLFLAARFSPSMEVLQYLISISAGALPKFLLQFAAPSNSNVLIMEYLVSQCGDVPWGVLGGAASANPKVAVVEYLVSQGADVNADYTQDGLFWSKPLYFAAAGNSNVDVLKYLIAHGADVNVAATLDGYFCRTPLHAAASENPNVEVLKCLIAQGADVYAKDDKGKTPLDVADTDEKKQILREAMTGNLGEIA